MSEGIESYIEIDDKNAELIEKILAERNKQNKIFSNQSESFNQNIEGQLSVICQTILNVKGITTPYALSEDGKTLIPLI